MILYYFCSTVPRYCFYVVEPTNFLFLGGNTGLGQGLGKGLEPELEPELKLWTKVEQKKSRK